MIIQFPDRAALAASANDQQLQPPSSPITDLWATLTTPASNATLKDQDSAMRNIVLTLQRASNGTDTDTCAQFARAVMIPSATTALFDPRNAHARKSILYFLSSLATDNDNLVPSTLVAHWPQDLPADVQYQLLQTLILTPTGDAAVRLRTPTLAAQLTPEIAALATGTMSVTAAAEALAALKTLVLVLPRTTLTESADLLAACRAVVTSHANLDLDHVRLAGMVAVHLTHSTASTPAAAGEAILAWADACTETVPRAIVLRAMLVCSLGAQLRESAPALLNHAGSRVLEALERGGLDPASKVVLFEALVAFCESSGLGDGSKVAGTAGKKGKKKKDKKSPSPALSSSSSPSPAPPSHAVPANLIDRLVATAWAHLEDAADAVQFKSKTICDMLLAQPAFAPAFVDRTLRTHATNKVKYMMLCSIMPVVGVAHLHERDPAILRAAFTALDHTATVGRVADVVAQWMMLAKAANLSAQFMPVYHDLAFTSLVHEDAVIRRHFATHLLKRMLAAENDLYASLVTNIRGIAPTNPASQYALEAHVAVERVARALDLPATATTSSTDFLNASPLTTADLTFLQTFLRHNLADVSPEFHENMQSRLGKIFERMRHSAYALHRTATRVPPNAPPEVLAAARDAHTLVDAYRTFLGWTVDAAMAWLVPGVTYPRALSVLLVIEALLATFGPGDRRRVPMPHGFNAEHCAVPEFPFDIPLDTYRNVTTLLDVVRTCPYDEIQGAAHRLLVQLPTGCAEVVRRAGGARAVLEHAAQWMASPRACDAQAGAVLVDVAYVIRRADAAAAVATGEDGMDVDDADLRADQFITHFTALAHVQMDRARANLVEAAAADPLPATFLAVRQIMRRLPAAEVDAVRMLQLAKDACQIVLPILADVSPEGNLPDDVREDVVGDEATETSQLVLSYSWRVVKQACDLLGGVAAKITVKGNVEFFRQTGEYFIGLMQTIRHRGAFSAVSPNLIVLCDRITEETDQVKTWLQNTLHSVADTDFSVTRRSGGLPYLIVALVTSPGCRKWLPITFAHLFNAVDAAPAQAAVEVQVNCMNVLRRLFEDSQLAKDASASIGPGFMLAIRKLTHADWGVRNAGLMLFSTLINRIFGSKKVKDERHVLNKVTGKEFFHRFPALHAFLLEHLGLAAAAEDSGASAALFPLLTLLARMAPSVFDAANAHLSLAAFVPVGMACASSRQWKVREMAAEAMVSLVSADAVAEHCAAVIRDRIPNAGQNAVHGYLLQLRALVRHYPTAISGSATVALAHQLRSARASNYALAVAYEMCAATWPAFGDLAAAWLADGVEGYGADLARVQLATAALATARSASVVPTLLRDADEQVRGVVLDHLAAAAALPPAARDALMAMLADGTTLIRDARLIKLAAAHDLPVPAARLAATLDAVRAGPLSVQCPLIHVLAAQAVDMYVAAFTEWTHSDVPLPLRSACAASLAAAVPRLAGTHRATVLWLATTRLVQDDDEDVRATTAQVLSAHLLDGTPTHYAAMVPAATAALAKQFDMRTQFQRVLDDLRHAATAAVAEKDDHVLFDKEDANLFKEKHVEAVLVLHALGGADVVARCRDVLRQASQLAQAHLVPLAAVETTAAGEEASVPRLVTELLGLGQSGDEEPMIVSS
ncbi:hypothetical protein AMAG_04513 [Allomyces macrogynus ATCC 38327]|uniref:Uncharacterized protein n=1 Tax=Allomyces macrogynus (strain ATCC 38327) TaxID=578462 RepID=A0A0L0S531_ALLM3|nr:hypothetical protein AMAG_04513 [Allomyces macrogynus ATCC 38327]|eukprot:KNE57648.1 hypothetical protein AMAG_04513 [Allomyces macrogynus ATCC 38327]